MQNLEIIKETLNSNNILATDEQLLKLNKFYELLIEYNKNINLTAITDINEVALKHFADSLININYYKQNSTLCDIGTGAGFPGLPIAIMRPDLKIALVDKDLQQNNIKRESFDYTTARAVAKLNILAEYCLPFTKTNGKMIAFKSNNTIEEIQTATIALNKLGGKVKEILHFDLKNITNNEVLNRNIIIIEKIKNTPTNYPRPKNKIQLNPV